MDVTFEFHHDGDGPPDLIELRGVNAEDAQELQRAAAGEIPADRVLMTPYWIGGRYVESGLFRAGRIRNVLIR